jgi:uncharacterized protein YlbG (UPF0298 family)
MVKRRKLIIYYTNNSIIDSLDKTVNVYYESKNNNFAILYVDSDQFDRLMRFLSKSNLITKIDVCEDIYEF